MALAGDDDGNLAIAEALHEREGIGILGHVDDSVIDTLAVERAGGRGALDAGGSGNWAWEIVRPSADGRPRRRT